MDLFQIYITKTNDLQTAVLATAFTNPLYVDDVRWEMWKETYFDQMQSWRAFNERTKFTVKHSQMARTGGERSLVEPPERQVTLRCNHCQGSLARRNGHLAMNGSTTDHGGTRITGPTANAGTVCSKCGRHLPRCAVCLSWLGTPDPLKSRDVKGPSNAEGSMAKLLSFCVSCDHGFHADHALAWFEKHQMCPMPDCRCMCGLA